MKELSAQDLEVLRRIYHGQRWDMCLLDILRFQNLSAAGYIDRWAVKLTRRGVQVVEMADNLGAL